MDLVAKPPKKQNLCQDCRQNLFNKSTSCCALRTVLKTNSPDRQFHPYSERTLTVDKFIFFCAQVKVIFVVLCCCPEAHRNSTTSIPSIPTFRSSSSIYRDLILLFASSLPLSLFCEISSAAKFNTLKHRYGCCNVSSSCSTSRTERQCLCSCCQRAILQVRDPEPPKPSATLPAGDRVQLPLGAGGQWISL